MGYINKIDLAKQAKLISGSTAHLAGSIDLGEDLYVAGDVMFTGIKSFTGNTYTLVVLDDLGQVYETDVSIFGLEADLTVNIGGGSVGGIDDGQFFPEGTTFDSMWRTLLTKVVHPIYTQPNTSISSNVSTSGIEIGTIINPTFDITFNKNDAGVELSRVLKRDGVEIATATPFTDTNIQVTEVGKTYIGTVTYAQGTCKNNNLGLEDCLGRIEAGSKNTSNIVYIGYRKAFWGFDNVPTTSAQVRGFSNSLLNPQNGSTFTINIPVGTSKVIFAYPANLRDVSSVKYIELASSEVKGNFTKTTVSVAGANGYSPINYKVYTYVPVEPYSIANTYNVTI